MAEPEPKPDEEAIPNREGQELLARVAAHIAANPDKYGKDGRPREAGPSKLPIPTAPAPAKVIQLPLWPEPVRGAPNSFLRSALFAAIQGKTQTRLKKQLLGSIEGVAVRHTGEQLDQSDLNVWEQAVHLARRHPLGNVCHVTRGYSRC
jgi:hypothetical protein